jgi:hypothetical protein
MSQLVLREKDVQKILNVCRTDAYQIIKNIKAEYEFSDKLVGSKVRTEDLAHAYDLKVEDIYRTLKK